MVACTSMDQTPAPAHIGVCAGWLALACSGCFIDIAPADDSGILCMRAYGDAADQHLEDVVGVADGVVLVGHFTDSIDFGGGALASADGPGPFTDGFVARIDSSCNHVWTHHLTGIGNDVVRAVAVAEDGRIAVAGTYDGPSTLDGLGLDAAAASETNGFVAILSASGTTEELHRVGGSELAHLDDLVFAAGSVFVAGREEGRAFVARLDPTGAVEWRGDAGAETARCDARVAIDAESDVLLGGCCGELGVEEAKCPIPGGGGGQDAFLVRWDAGGALRQAMAFGGQLDDFLNSIGADSEGNVLLLGSLKASTVLGGETLTSAGHHDILVARLDDAGEPLWSHLHGGESDEHGHTLTLGPSGEVYLTIDAELGVDLGGGFVTTAGVDATFAELDLEGAHRRTRTFGDAADQQARAVAIAGDGAVLLAGDLMGSIAGPGGEIRSKGLNDVFLLRVAP
jgi:hypothetical protein